MSDKYSYGNQEEESIWGWGTGVGETGVTNEIDHELPKNHVHQGGLRGEGSEVSHMHIYVYILFALSTINAFL